MRRKGAFITFCASHFLIRFACFYLLYGALPRSAGSSVLAATGSLIFILLSVGLVPFAGRFSDALPKIPLGAIGGLMTAAGAFLSDAYPFPAVFFAGVGAALFCVGGAGENLSFARGTFGRLAGFSAAGALGAAAGAGAAAWVILPPWLPALGALGAGAACALFCRASRYPRKVTAFSPAVRSFLPEAGALGLALLIRAGVCAALLLVPVQYLRGGSLALIFLALAAGRLSGGLFADRFGARRTAVVALLLALPLLTLFSSVSVLLYIGIFFAGVPFSPTVCAACAALPETPRFSYGLAGMAGLLGSLGGLLPLSLSRQTEWGLTGIALLIAAGAAVALFTDSCPGFRETSSAQNGKGE